MPVASPPISARSPAALQAEERGFIKQTVERFYGPNAIVRNYGPDPNRLNLHVETDVDPGMERYDCFGVLLTRFDRDQLSLEVMKRGTKVRGNSKLAYRQGIIL